jgi:hypothetical protein
MVTVKRTTRAKAYGRVTSRGTSSRSGRQWRTSPRSGIRRPARPRLFLPVSTRQMATTSAAARWLGAAGLIAAAASWSVLASLLAS